MARASNLIRRGAIYYALITVPTDLWLAMGENGKPVKQKWVSLRTADYAEARARKPVVVDQWAGTFADMRRRRDLTGADIAIAIYDHYTAKVEQGDRERIPPTEEEIWAAFDRAVEQSKRPHPNGPGPFDAINSMTDVEILANKAKWAANRRRARLNRLRADLGTGDTRIIEPEADAFLKAQGFQIAKGGEQYRDLCQKLMRAEIEAFERIAEHERGDFTGKIKDPIIAEPTERPEPIGAPTETLMQLFAKYEKANPKKMQADSMKQVRRDVEHFAAFVGPSFRASKIDRATVASWMDVLYEYPVKGKPPVKAALR